MGAKTFGVYPERIPYGDYLQACAKMQMLPVKLETTEEKVAAGNLGARSDGVIFGKKDEQNI